MSEILNILIVGVGGQGVLLASEILSEAAMHHGLDVKKSEVHGMSQRGGVVNSHVRIGKKVYSPLIDKGLVDVLMAFETAEGLRAIDWLKPDGAVISSLTRLVPPITTTGEYTYPENPAALIKHKVDIDSIIEAANLTLELGNARLVNTILLGVLSNLLDIPEAIWSETIQKRVPRKFIDLNLQAFRRGREHSVDTATIGG